jgi:hypothetical protein
MRLQETIKACYKKIASKETWQRVSYLMRYHDPGEVRRISKEDYVPFALAIVIAFLGISAVIFIIFLIRKIFGA